MPDGLAVPGCDANVVPAEGRRKRLLIADMDSTIIGVECIDELADFAGLKAEVAAITEAAMRGELDFEAALVARVGLLRGLPASVLEECYAERVRLNPGARTLVRTMAALGAATALVSGGFTFFSERVAQAAGFARHQANELLVADGLLTGDVARPILGRRAKLAALHALAAEAGVRAEAALAVATAPTTPTWCAPPASASPTTPSRRSPPSPTPGSSTPTSPRSSPCKASPRPSGSTDLALRLPAPAPARPAPRASAAWASALRSAKPASSSGGWKVSSTVPPVERAMHVAQVAREVHLAPPAVEGRPAARAAAGRRSSPAAPRRRPASSGAKKTPKSADLNGSTRSPSVLVPSGKIAIRSPRASRARSSRLLRAWPPPAAGR